MYNDSESALVICRSDGSGRDRRRSCCSGYAAHFLRSGDEWHIHLTFYNRHVFIIAKWPLAATIFASIKSNIDRVTAEAVHLIDTDPKISGFVVEWVVFPLLRFLNAAFGVVSGSSNDIAVHNYVQDKFVVPFLPRLRRIRIVTFNRPDNEWGVFRDQNDGCRLCADRARRNGSG